MTHKVHPKIFRIRKSEDWLSRWFEKKNMGPYLQEDFKIREFFKKNFSDIGIDSVIIERSPGEIKIIISTARPGLLIGRGGEGIEKIKKRIESGTLKKDERKALKLEVVEIRSPWSRASLVAQWIAKQIERRVPYRRALKQALSRMAGEKEIKGARVEVAGRLNGAEIARREWLKQGRLPRQTIRADIDYSQARAECTYGTIGVKVWIYKGEKME